jgi:hypothetical protein
MRVDIGRERARLAGRLKEREARIDLRQIGAGLREAFFILAVLGGCPMDIRRLP